SLPVFISICAFMILAFGLSDKNSDRDPKIISDRNNIPYQTAAVDSKKMDGNNISTWYRNNGSLNRNPSTGNAGFEWPKGSGLFARFASGLWIGAVVGDDTLVVVADYSSEYLPGYIDQNGNPQGKDDPQYRIYKINKGDIFSNDYQNWPVNQGAHSDINDKPFLMGDQTMFYSYTDGYPESHGNNSGQTSPLKAQILQTNFCVFKIPGFLNSMIITEMRIINRNDLPWTKCFFGLFTDDAVGVPTDDAVGCDTILNLGYTYNFNPIDGDYGFSPPAVGFMFLKSAESQSQSDTVKYYSPPMSNNLIIKPGYKDLGMTAFNLYASGNPIIGEPSNYIQTYLNLQGIRRNGTTWINPFTNQATKFAFSGDPFYQNGWIQTEGYDRRFLISTGPTIVNPGDTQTIIFAQIISNSINNLASVNSLKFHSQYLKNFYDYNFNISISAKSPDLTSYSYGNNKIYLSWNDTAEKVNYENKFTGSYYNFQGYNIYQISSYSPHPSESDTLLIKTFDKTDGIKDIRDSIYLEEYQSFTYGIVQKGSDNGISRYIELDKDSLGNQNFINGAEYKYCVTAYYFDSLAGPFSLPKVLESPKIVLKVIPQNIASGTTIYYSLSDTVSTDQKDNASTPVVIDPVKLLNATYSSVFGMNNNIMNWTLTRNFSGSSDVLFQNVENFTGKQDTAKTADGLMFIHKLIRDSGIVRDPDDNFYKNNNIPTNSIQRAWSYEPAENNWFRGPDTSAVITAKVFTNRQFDSRSLGMSFPTQARFNNFRSRVIANGKYFIQGTGTNTLPMGGPLRKIKIVFGENSKAYRYAPPVNVLLTDTNLLVTPYSDFADVPFSVYAVDELDSTQGNPRRLNIGFVDADANGQWDPDDSPLGKYQLTYIFASDYSEVINENYVTRSGQAINPGIGSPVFGFPSLDIMYAWLPRKKSASSTWSDGDILTVTPYRITRADFVPGFPLKYSWTINGSTFNNSELAASQINNIKAYPNPYYGFSSLEFNDAGEKIIYFSNLPGVCDIFIYSLDGALVKQISRNTSDPNSSLSKWDIKNDDGKYVASGMYVVYIDCKAAGAKTLKIAVFQSR
ncbi:MAG TPA: hypothetical protein PLX80_14135, partial [Ignavibacteria bacterium]|nr:hypothetical protein [Ignavibacteria bacterium]